MDYKIHMILMAASRKDMDGLNSGWEIMIKSREASSPGESNGLFESDWRGGGNKKKTHVPGLPGFLGAGRYQLAIKEQEKERRQKASGGGEQTAEVVWYS
ncbi:hypothetical protein PM082_014795 [Marasmius tenuissimus]|nr:hypothetical protein PM082_014795 [Marasmius tenuissimus]